jgi:hypothetical protein
MTNVVMEVDNVIFRGTGGGGTAILAQGSASAFSTIENCTFTELAVGVEILGGVPTIRRCLFEHLSEVGILVGRGGKQLSAKSLGQEGDPASGWNTFSFAEGDGLAVVNNTSSELVMEMNDWGTDDFEEIEALIGGPGASDFDPPLTSGSGLLAGALYCTVWDASTQLPLTQATVTLSPSPYEPLEFNVDGVYVFPAIEGTRYTITVAASGYDAVSMAVTVGDGETVSVVVPMGLPQSKTGCYAGYSGADPKTDWAFALLCGLCLGAMLLYPRMVTMGRKGA